MPYRFFLLTMLSVLTATNALGADRFFGYNSTASTIFTGVYIAPHDSSEWGSNEALNDKDKTWEPGERLAMKRAFHGLIDLKVVDQSGRTCIKHGIDLAKDSTFEIRDDDLIGCKR